MQHVAMDKLKGRQIETEDYDALPEEARQKLGEDLARFYAELHAPAPARMKAAGAQPVSGWHTAAAIRKKALPLEKSAGKVRAAVLRWLG